MIASNAKIKSNEFYLNPAPTTNVIIVNRNNICLIRRNIEPFKGGIALPGGFVDYGETVEIAAIREAKEETGIDIELISLLGVYSDPLRNPSKHTISTVFVAKSSSTQLRESNEGTPFWVKITELKKLQLAFDHNKIVSDYLKWKKGSSSK